VPSSHEAALEGIPQESSPKNIGIDSAKNVDRSELTAILESKGISYDMWDEAVEGALVDALQTGAGFSSPPIADTAQNLGPPDKASSLVPSLFIDKLNTVGLGYFLGDNQALKDSDPGLAYVLAHGTAEDIKDHLLMAASRIVLEVIKEWVKESGEELERFIKSENEKQTALKIQESRKEQADEMRNLALKAAREARDAAKQGSHPDETYIASLISVLASSKQEVEGRLALGHIAASESIREIDYAIRTLESLKSKPLSGSAPVGD
jgi:hypothetical protein